VLVICFFFCSETVPDTELEELNGMFVNHTSSFIFPLSLLLERRELLENSSLISLLWF
jgi:hypothetical protein